MRFYFGNATERQMPAPLTERNKSKGSNHLSDGN
jgi:hypothetical protein